VAGAAGQHVRQYLMGEQHGRGEVQVDRPDDLAGGLGLEGGQRFDPGIVDQDLDRSERLQCPCDERVPDRLGGDVPRHRDGVHAERLHLAGGRVQAVLVAAVQRDVDSLAASRVATCSPIPWNEPVTIALVPRSWFIAGLPLLCGRRVRWPPRFGWCDRVCLVPTRCRGRVVAWCGA
jgi:hypothetical protein